MVVLRAAWVLFSAFAGERLLRRIIEAMHALRGERWSYREISRKLLEEYVVRLSHEGVRWLYSGGPGRGQCSPWPGVELRCRGRGGAAAAAPRVNNSGVRPWPELACCWRWEQVVRQGSGNAAVDGLPRCIVFGFSAPGPFRLKNLEILVLGDLRRQLHIA